MEIIYWIIGILVFIYIQWAIWRWTSKRSLESKYWRGRHLAHKKGVEKREKDD